MAKEKIKKPTKTELKKISDSLKKSGTKKEAAFNTKDVMKWLFDGGSTEVPVIFMKNNKSFINNNKKI